MARLRDVIGAPELASLKLLTPLHADRAVSGVSLAERLGDIGGSEPDTFILLSAGAAAEAGTYRLDVAMRRASTHRVTAIAMPVPAGFAIPGTAALIAERGEVTVLRIPAGVDVGALAATLGRELAGGAIAAVSRAERGLTTLLELHEPVDVAAVLGAVRAGLPEAATGEPGPDELAAPIVVEGSIEDYLRAPAGGDASDVVGTLLLHVGAGVVARTLAAARRAAEAPIRSRAELLTELLASDPRRAPGLVARARSIGVPIDGWHVVARLEMPDEAGDEDLELRETTARLALQTARASGGTWHPARSESAIVLVRTFDPDPGSRAVRVVERSIHRVVEATRERFRNRPVFAGVGGLHLGPAGLRASATEARAAASLGRTGKRHGVGTFDATGLRRMLLEWYATDSARESISILLAPLERLGPKRADTAIRTLQAYLDHQGSVSRTARALFLHRNAVAYRIKRIAELLHVDLTDPEDRLALQLACRARLLSPSEPDATVPGATARTRRGRAPHAR